MCVGGPVVAEGTCNGQVLLLWHMVMCMCAYVRTLRLSTPGGAQVSVFKMEPMDYARESKITLEHIQKLEQGVPILRAKQPDAVTGAGGGAPAPYGGGAFTVCVLHKSACV